jgi:sterol desaturase/sphingolipid hydroxylase (fatty acid hydroxylase superfamily)
LPGRIGRGVIAALALQAVQVCSVLLLIVVVFGPLERFFAVRRARFFYPGWTTNLGWYFAGTVTSLAVLAPISAALNLPLGWRMALAMIVGEFGFYWGHRWSHEWPWLWRFHAVHHSAEHIHFLVNTRAHPVDVVFTRLCGLVLLYATGLASPIGDHPALVPALVLFVGSLWSYFIHANVRWRLGPFEELFSSPAFHHWHHTRDDHKDHNYASMLPIYDRLFGTFYLPREWPAAYGTDTPMPAGVLGQFAAPFAVRRPG